jgi:small subunit ribosomal protein S18
MKKKKITRRLQKNIAPKKCFYCEEKKGPSYTDVASLKKFLSERGKIIPRSRDGLCAKHQRHLALSIKHARHLALLPFIVR